MRTIRQVPATRADWTMVSPSIPALASSRAVGSSPRDRLGMCLETVERWAETVTVHLSRSALSHLPHPCRDRATIADARYGWYGATAGAA